MAIWQHSISNGWGSFHLHGEYLGYSKVQDQVALDVQQIYQTNHAFAALKAGGGVVSWGSDGDENDIGDSFQMVQVQISEDVQYIHSNRYAFAALKTGGSVVTWGHKKRGGVCGEVHAQLADNVQHIYSTNYAFAVLKADGGVISWGSQGQTFSCSQMRLVSVDIGFSRIQNQVAVNVQHIYSTGLAFAALKVGGTTQFSQSSSEFINSLFWAIGIAIFVFQTGVWESSVIWWSSTIWTYTRVQH